MLLGPAALLALAALAAGQSADQLQQQPHQHQLHQHQHLHLQHRQPPQHQQPACAPADRPARRRDNASLACSACRLRSEVRQLNLAFIRDHVLAKLGFAHAPNTTGRVLPRVPADLVRAYERDRGAAQDMLADQPPEQRDGSPPTGFRALPDDDFHARTDRVFAFPRPPKKSRSTDPEEGAARSTVRRKRSPKPPAPPTKRRRKAPPSPTPPFDYA